MMIKISDATSDSPDFVVDDADPTRFEEVVYNAYEAEGISGFAIAEAFGVTKDTVWLWSRGASLPDTETRRKVVTWLNDQTRQQNRD